MLVARQGREPGQDRERREGEAWRHGIKQK